MMSKKRWADRHAVTERPQQPCIRLLLGKRCGWKFGRSCPSHDVPGGDHMTVWFRDGKCVALVSQPYGALHSDLTALVDLAREHGFYLHIDSGVSWHASDAVKNILHVEVWRSKSDALYEKDRAIRPQPLGLEK